MEDSESIVCYFDYNFLRYGSKSISDLGIIFIQMTSRDIAGWKDGFTGLKRNGLKPAVLGDGSVLCSDRLISSFLLFDQFSVLLLP